MSRHVVRSNCRTRLGSRAKGDMTALAALALLAGPGPPRRPHPPRRPPHTTAIHARSVGPAAIGRLRAAVAHLIADLEGDDRLACIGPAPGLSLGGQRGRRVRAATAPAAPG